MFVFICLTPWNMSKLIHLILISAFMVILQMINIGITQTESFMYIVELYFMNKHH